MHSFVEWFDHYFHCSRKQRNSFLALAGLCFLLFGSAWLYQAYFISPQTIDFSAFKTTLQVFEQEKNKALAASNDYYYNNKNNHNTITAEFPFNPNTASAEELKALGLSPKTVQSMLNYRNKGGQFRKAEDFKKIYTLSEKDFNRLAPYLRFEAQAVLAKHTESPPPTTFEPFAFNPNSASIEDLQRLGLSEKTAHLIVNYRNKGGQFRCKSDLSKIYGMQESDFLRLQPFIQLPDSIERKTPINTGFVSNKNDKAVININTATAEEWTQLRGIGLSFAQRIIKFRTALGGFIRVEQVAEVYGFPDSTFQKIRPQLSCNQAIINKININTASEESLKTHPYLRFRHVNAILKYRAQKGKFNNIEILQTFPEFDDGENTYAKLRPYLTL